MGEPRTRKLWFVLLASATWFRVSMGATFTIANYCSYQIWLGTLAGAGTSQLSTTGFKRRPGQTVQLAAPVGWSGRIWARTGCVFDAAGAGVCQTGDCGGRMQCSGAGATPPATLLEVTLGKGGGEDFYDVSLVDGYNLPVVAIPRAQLGACNTTGCMADLNRSCPKELQMDCGSGAIACRSACEAFGQDRYCCSGAYDTPAACHPTAYSSIFKTACPRAYSYAYDDSTSTFTCNAYDYTIAFCLPTSGIKESDAMFLGARIDGDQGTSAGGSPPAYSNGGAGAYKPPIDVQQQWWSGCIHTADLQLWRRRCSYTAGDEGLVREHTTYPNPAMASDATPVRLAFLTALRCSTIEGTTKPAQKMACQTYSSCRAVK